MKEIQTSQECDILIIGSGITGSTAAIMLQKAGYNTVIVDKDDLNKFKHGESLTPKCKNYFDSIGIHFDRSEAVEYYGINSTWGDDELKESNFIFNPYGNGLGIDRQSFEKKLVDEALASGCNVNLSHEIKGINFEKDFWKVSVQYNKEVKSFRARLLIIATGGNSFQQIDKCKVSYYDNLMAFSKIQHQPFVRESELYLTVEAVSHGWFYCNKIPGERIVGTFFSDSDIISTKTHKIEFIDEQVSQTNWYKKNKAVLFKDDDLVVGDARTKWVQNQSGTGWLRLGDCAYTIDPLSGHGIAKNLEMIFFVVDHINEFLNIKGNINTTYSTFNQENFCRFLHQRTDVYKREQRWSQESFWKRRNN